MANNANYDKMFEMLSKRIGTDPEKLRSVAQNGSIEDLMRSMNPNDAMKIQNLLQNKTELERLMKSEQAQAILKKLSEGK